MPGRLLPLFPLDVAMLPHARLPLHIYEERYKEMIGECLETESEFGVVLRRAEGILRAGCTASIVDVLKRYEDGRMDILTAGRRRFEIEEIDEGRSFLRAEVRFYQDSEYDEPAAETVSKARQAYALLTDSSEQDTPDERAPELSFRLAAISGDHDFRQMLLASLSEAERMEKVAEHLAWLVFRKQTQRAMKKVASTNGHGRHVLGFGEQE
jgi:Lon protease-like protein